MNTWHRSVIYNGSPKMIEKCCMSYSQSSSAFLLIVSGHLDLEKQLDPEKSLKSLVYAAAEAGTMRLLETILSLPAGRVVFEACKEESSLPEDIAAKNGHGKVAEYLRGMTKRLVDDLCTIQCYFRYT